MVTRMRSKLSRVKQFQSPYAPGFVVLGGCLQHLTDGSEIYVMGKGFTYGEAETRMLGEAAERYSLWQAQPQAHWAEFDPAAKRDARLFDRADIGCAEKMASHGCAAHNHLNTAAHLALCELWERRIVADWWGGKIKAHNVSPKLFAACGLADLIAKSRTNAIEQRRSQFLVLDNTGPVWVVAAVTTDDLGGQVAIGFAGGPSLASTLCRAFLEVLSIELETADLYRAKLEGQAIVSGSNRALVKARQMAVQEKLRAGQASLKILPDCAVNRPPCHSLQDIVARSDEIGSAVRFIDHTVAGLGIPVVRAIFTDPSQNPFVNIGLEVLPI